MAFPENHPQEPIIDEPLEPPVAEETNLVCGYPKTGRTWLRFMLASGIAAHYALDIDVDLTNSYSVVPNSGGEIIPGQPNFYKVPGLPKIEMSHAPYSVDTHGDANIVFLTRDPRDIMVSHWLHNTKQIKRSTEDLTGFVRNPASGIDAFLQHLGGWAPALCEELTITYEAMRHNPVSSLKRLIDRFGVPLSDEEVARAVEAASMESMRKKEVERGIAGHESLYDRNDPEARRVRRGKVGGFTDYLAPEDEAFIRERITASDDRIKGIIALTGYFSR
jgi:Sulfotransferase domain